MKAAKEQGFWFIPYPEFALVSGRGRDSKVGVGDLIISVNGRRGSMVAADLQQNVERVLEVVCAQTGVLHRIRLPADLGGRGDVSNHPLAHFWPLDGIYRRAVLADQLRLPSGQSRTALKILRLLRQRRTLARHLYNSRGSARALRDELDESQSRAAATALRLGEELAAAAEKVEHLWSKVAEVTSERDTLRAQLDEARRTIDRLTKRPAAASRRVSHVKLGNELFRNRTGARS